MMADSRGEPAGYGYSYADMAGGYSGALAALIALWHRKRTGRGQFVDLSQFEALASLAGPALLDIAVNGRTQEPPGWRSQEAPAAPHGVYRCRPRGGDDDRWIVIAVRSQAEWERFAGAIGNPGMDRRSEIPHALPPDAQSRGTRRACRAMGRNCKRPRPRWRCCSAPESPPAWRSTAPTSPPIRTSPSARFFAPVKLPDNSSTRRDGRADAPFGDARIDSHGGARSRRGQRLHPGRAVGTGRAERAELIAEGAVWG